MQEMQAKQAERKAKACFKRGAHPDSRRRGLPRKQAPTHARTPRSVVSRVRACASRRAVTTALPAPSDVRLRAPPHCPTAGGGAHPSPCARVTRRSSPACGAAPRSREAQRAACRRGAARAADLWRSRLTRVQPAAPRRSAWTARTATNVNACMCSAPRACTRAVLARCGGMGWPCAAATAGGA